MYPYSTQLIIAAYQISYHVQFPNHRNKKILLSVDIQLAVRTFNDSYPRRSEWIQLSLATEIWSWIHQDYLNKAVI